jgi:hypothetical protein
MMDQGEEIVKEFIPFNILASSKLRCYYDVLR